MTSLAHTSCFPKGALKGIPTYVLRKLCLQIMHWMKSEKKAVP